MGRERRVGPKWRMAAPSRPQTRIAVRRRPQSEQDSTSGYPSLREHLATRRSFLTWAGASLFTTAAGVHCISGKMSGGRFLQARVPETGDLAVTLTGGGAVRFYVNIACFTVSGDDTVDTADNRVICREVLGRHTYAELSAALAQGISGPLFASLEGEIREDLIGSYGLYPCGGDAEVALTILSLTA